MCFLFNDTATTEIYTLSLHDAIPISSTRSGSPCGTLSSGQWVKGQWGAIRAIAARAACSAARRRAGTSRSACSSRSEEHTSELQSRQYLVCRLLLEKKQISTRASPLF